MPYIKSMKITWDDNKNLANIAKHGINFNEVVTLFEAPYTTTEFDADHSTLDEPRFKLFGSVPPHGIILVIFAERVEEVYEVISARPYPGKKTQKKKKK